MAILIKDRGYLVVIPAQRGPWLVDSMLLMLLSFVMAHYRPRESVDVEAVEGLSGTVGGGGLSVDPYRRIGLGGVRWRVIRRRNWSGR